MNIYNINSHFSISYIYEFVGSKCHSLHVVYHWIKPQDEIPVYSTSELFVDVLAEHVDHSFLL